MSTNEQAVPQPGLAEELHAKDMAELAETEGVTEQQKNYFPPVSNGEFATQCLGAAWNVVTDGVINIMLSTELTEEEKKLKIINLMQPLRTAHILTVQHTAELIDNYEYHVIQQGNHDGVVAFVLQDLIAGVRNNYTGIPRGSLAERHPDTDKDPNWQFGALPFERIFKGERIPVKFQTNKETGYGYFECLNHQIPNPANPNGLINVQTTVPCIRLKKGNVIPNAVWRWQEVDEKRLKQHWLQGEDLFPSVPKKKTAEANPIEKAPANEGNENGNKDPEPSNK